MKGLEELDSRISMQAYLREKKEAILLDRKEQDDDTISHVERVQKKYATINQTSDERKSFFENSRKANSIAVESVRLNEVEEALRFRSPRKEVQEDLQSVASQFVGEENEWSALQKYYLLENNRHFEQERKDKTERARIMREELLKQQDEFKQRKAAHKQDMRNYFSQLLSRNRDLDQMDLQK